MNKIFILLLTLSTATSFAQQADLVKIQEHFSNLLDTEFPRNHEHIEVLDSVAAYILGEFSQYADTSYYQTYEAYEKEYRNVICVFGSENKQTIVVGAHYDVCGEQDGADDNASGVVGLLELARMLKGQKLKYRIEIVAYTLEEPPYFRSRLMGSYVHAQSLKANNTDVYGMFCLEMIGYFDDTKHSQDYPLGILSMIYGNRGNYITLVNKFGKGKFSRKFNKRFKKQKRIKTKKFNGPASMPGIDFSDHLNYWQFGYSALMITDTAFYRNKNYHQTTDTLETLDFERMGKVIVTVFFSLVRLK